MDDVKANLSARLLSSDAASDAERGNTKDFVEDAEVGICLSWANVNA